MIRKQLPKEALVSFYKNFEVEYTHNSTAIEGNTLSLIQTKAVLEDGISIGGKTLREIYEVVNHQKAFDFVKRCIFFYHLGLRKRTALNKFKTYIMKVRYGRCVYSRALTFSGVEVQYNIEII